MQRRGHSFVFRRRSWQGEGLIELHYMSTFAEWMVIDGVSTGYDPPPEARVLNQSGKAPGADWAPHAVLRDGVTFVRLRWLVMRLDRCATDSGCTDKACVSWAPETREAIMKVGARSLHFSPGNRQMRIGTTQVQCPAAPFVLRPVYGALEGAIYVPLKPVLDVLGGTYRVSPSGHRLFIDLKPQPAPKPLIEHRDEPIRH